MFSEIWGSSCNGACRNPCDGKNVMFPTTDGTRIWNNELTESMFRLPSCSLDQFLSLWAGGSWTEGPAHVHQMKQHWQSWNIFGYCRPFPAFLTFCSPSSQHLFPILFLSSGIRASLLGHAMPSVAVSVGPVPVRRAERLEVKAEVSEWADKVGASWRQIKEQTAPTCLDVTVTLVSLRGSRETFTLTGKPQDSFTGRKLKVAPISQKNPI